MLRTTPGGLSRMGRALAFDREGVHLRATALTMATVLGTYGWSLLVEGWAGLHVDSVVQAVVISSSYGRVQRVLDRTGRLLAGAVLPGAAAGATELATLVQRHPDTGDAVFVLAMSATIWVRRFGPRATRAGTLVVLPLVAVLVVPGGIAPTGGHERTAWAAVTALFAVAWGTLLTRVGRRTGFVPRPPSAAVTRVPPRARPGLPASTRMALQMATALGAAFALGRAAWPDHWAWTVLTAFLVCSGAHSRADVLVKGVRRAAGASAGTVVAAVLAGAFGPRSDAAVVLVFAVLALATWLRELSYAWWAGCVTAVLSLLYDWFGQSSGDLLRTRLAGIAVGAVLGVAASWLVLPVRTSAVVRARTASALAGLGELLEADWGEPRAVRVAQARFRYRLGQLDAAAAPLRLLLRLPLPGAPAARRRVLLRAAGALRACAPPVAALTTTVTAPPGHRPPAEPLTARRTATANRTRALRRALANPAPPAGPAPGRPGEPPPTVRPAAPSARVSGEASTGSLASPGPATPSGPGGTPAKADAPSVTLPAAGPAPAHGHGTERRAVDGEQIGLPAPAHARGTESTQPVTDADADSDAVSGSEPQPRPGSASPSAAPGKASPAPSEILPAPAPATAPGAPAGTEPTAPVARAAPVTGAVRVAGPGPRGVVDAFDALDARLDVLGDVFGVPSQAGAGA